VLQKIARKDQGVQKCYIARVRRVAPGAAMAAQGGLMFPSEAATVSLVVGESAAQVLTRASFSAEEICDAATALPAVFPPRVAVVGELGWESHGKIAVALDAGAATAKAEARFQSLGGTNRKAKRVAEHTERERLRIEAKAGTGATASPLLAGATGGGTEADSSDSKAASAKRRGATQTTFRLLGEPLPDGTVLVECRPSGGQRHQIRAHLACMGWPIANDAVYGGSSDIPYGATSAAVSESAQLQAAIGLAYADDAEGTLRRVLTSEHCLRAWCPKCKWTARMLLGGEQESRGEVPPELQWVFEGDDGGGGGGGGGSQDELDAAQQQPHDDGGQQAQQTQPPPRGVYSNATLEVATEIWLHSMRYILPAAGLDVKAPLPAWAEPAQAIVAANFAEEDAVPGSSATLARETAAAVKAEALRQTEVAVAIKARTAEKAKAHIARGEWMRQQREAAQQQDASETAATE
jgi:Spy/CpxP family protein refolding chaperone